MNLPDDHRARLERARLSLDGLAIGDAFGEMMSVNSGAARRRADLGLIAGTWWHTDDTEMQAVFEQTPESETREGLRRALEVPFFTSARVAARRLGNGSLVTAPDAVPYAVWSAAKHLDDYREALIETVSGDGDCDTNCAIVGGIVVLHAGRESIPKPWQEAQERLSIETM